MCGEKMAWTPKYAARAGSPPRVRGKGCGIPCIGCCIRITPACAGKSVIIWNRWHIHRGSPPRVRGKDGAGMDVTGAKGITPACAGKSQRNGWSRRPRQDHPRVCGEKATDASPATMPTKSPPRVRGKGVVGDIHVFHVGITPACAGKRFQQRTKKYVRAGSPPRVRGKVIAYYILQ